MLRQIRLFLGPQRIRALFLLLALTGLGNLILNSLRGELDWAESAQTVLALVFIGGAIAIVASAYEPFQRGRILGLVTPAFGLIVLAALFLPDWLPVVAGAGVGWVIAGFFIFRPRGPMAYQQAVKLLRKSQYKDAVEIMDTLIKDEPDDPNHYRFRAELLRVWSKLDRARRDYQKMTKMVPDSPVAWNGLAEVELQAGRYPQAREAALRALDLSPGEWVAAYNLGMIEDRLKLSDQVIEHLNLALSAKVPDARHRLLIHFYLARAYARLGQQADAEREVKALRSQQGGLNEWQVVMQSDQADTLRSVLADDIAEAEALTQGESDVMGLA